MKLGGLVLMKGCLESGPAVEADMVPRRYGGSPEFRNRRRVTRGAPWTL